MLDYPLILPTETEYDSLGVSADVSDSEIRDAQMSLIAAVRRKQAAVNEQIQTTASQVVGLEDALRRSQKIADNPAASPSERMDVERELIPLMVKASRIDPRFSDLCERAEELRRQEESVNRMKILRRQDREDYDRRNPPLSLFKLEQCGDDRFATENSTMLGEVRRALTSFFEQKGEEVFYPSDLARTDFRSDRAWHAKVDALEDL